MAYETHEGEWNCGDDHVLGGEQLNFYAAEKT